MKTRINFLDNVRTAMIFLVVLLHAGMTYMAGFDSFWLVSDPEKINALGLINMYLDIFVMFAIFFISGYLIPYSLSSKTTIGFVISKFNRILLPWMVAVFVLIPAYKAIFLYARGLPQQEWYSYFHLFSRSGTDLTFFANSPTQNWLWFLPVLFVFQIVYLVMVRLHVFRINISMKTGIILTFLAGLAYNLTISTLGLTGWYHSWIFDFQRERLLVYFLVFLLGSLANKHNVFHSQHKNKGMYITANIVLTFSLGIFTAVALNLFFNILDPDRNFYYVSSWFDRAAYYATSLLSMLSILYVILYVFRFSFNRTNKLTAILNRNSYQVYIIHMIVLGVFALILAHTTLPAIIKYVLLVVMTYVVSNLLVFVYNKAFQYKAMIKTVGVAVFLTGLIIVTQTGTPVAQSELSNKVQEAHSPETGLHAAVITGDMETVKQHIQAGSDLNIQEPSGGSSPLITAALFGNIEAARALVEAGADIDFQNNDGSTALHTAAFFCRTEIVELLLKSGADTTIRNQSGSTALESVTAPFELVEGVYDYFAKTLGPLGLKLDYDRLRQTRPVIAVMLQQ